MAQILLVDDEPMLRRTLRTMLEKAGHAVTEAADGQQALMMFTAARPDLVLTDIVMPNREGVETIGEMRLRDASVPIIAMSGGGSSTNGELFLSLAHHLGASQTLSKPIRQAALLEAVDACLVGRNPS